MTTYVCIHLSLKILIYFFRKMSKIIFLIVFVVILSHITNGYKNNQLDMGNFESMKNYPQSEIDKFNGIMRGIKQPTRIVSKSKWVKGFNKIAEFFSKLFKKLDIKIEYKPYKFIKGDKTSIVWIPFDGTSNHYMIGKR